jgi:hypothetical protein
LLKLKFAGPAPHFANALLYWAFAFSNPTVHILKAKSMNIRSAVAVPAPTFNSSTVRHCVQPKSAKKLNHGTTAWLWPCMYKS